MVSPVDAGAVLRDAWAPLDEGGANAKSFGFCGSKRTSYTSPTSGTATRDTIIALVASMGASPGTSMRTLTRTRGLLLTVTPVSLTSRIVALPALPVASSCARCAAARAATWEMTSSNSPTPIQQAPITRSTGAKKKMAVPASKKHEPMIRRKFMVGHYPTKHIADTGAK